LQRALVSLREVVGRIREATFLLHPAVLDQVGLAEAVEKLASITKSRSGIDISTVVDYPVKNSIDTMVFAVVRELVSNVERLPCHACPDRTTRCRRYVPRGRA
jgi:two-component system NarL family sensor kinase